MCIEKKYPQPSKKLCAEGKRLYAFIIKELEDHRNILQDLRTEISLLKGGGGYIVGQNVKKEVDK